MDTVVYFSEVFGSEEKQKLKTIRNNSMQRFNRTAPTNKNFTLEREKQSIWVSAKRGSVGRETHGKIRRETRTLLADVLSEP